MAFVYPGMQPPPQPSGSVAATAEKSNGVAFLADWKSNHRELTDEQREHVGNYIRAIVARSGAYDSPDEATKLWIKFRTNYDDLGAGRYGKTDREDVQKSMRLL